ncbi:(d)CMP kinase [Allosphingosinicella deserti]|uniref:Cytidylate kinase n=1 Tax=Allosphingosinicella deserti TaxID=2116704 RepID=A0A2P7QS07_9SPHN|nr:(d)CMP kinase [Sphingomonas deserti]PSJ40763.1 (d)CMP kinase [Sphingomonas deserti]
MIVAVDGPAASGKGTIARAIARHYGLPHLDTGLLYRAAGLALLRGGGDPSDEVQAVAACALTGVDFADPELKSEAAGGIASQISAYPGVRAALIERQRVFAAQPGGAVLDGRDIGTVIAPAADAKLFVTAAPEVRARRRFDELERLGMKLPFAEVLADIEARDARDRSRAAAPLTMAGDAHLVDTSGLGVDEAIARALDAVRARLGER